MNIEILEDEIWSSMKSHHFDIHAKERYAVGLKIQSKLLVSCVRNTPTVGLKSSVPIFFDFSRGPDSMKWPGPRTPVLRLLL